MIGTPEEEKQKDEVLQQVNDTLEKYKWGAECERTVIRIVLSGKLNLDSIHVNQKERTIKCFQ